MLDMVGGVFLREAWKRRFAATLSYRVSTKRHANCTSAPSVGPMSCRWASAKGSNSPAQPRGCDLWWAGAAPRRFFADGQGSRIGQGRARRGNQQHGASGVWMENTRTEREALLGHHPKLESAVGGRRRDLVASQNQAHLGVPKGANLR